MLGLQIARYERESHKIKLMKTSAPFILLDNMCTHATGNEAGKPATVELYQHCTVTVIVNVPDVVCVLIIP